MYHISFLYLSFGASLLLAACCGLHTLQIMEKFLTKPKDAHTAVKTTARDRLQNYPKGTLHEDDGRLFCSTCNVVLDHTRKSTIDKHLESATHVQKSRNSETTGKQQTLKTSLNCKTAAKVFLCVHYVCLHNPVLFFGFKDSIVLFIKGVGKKPGSPHRYFSLFSSWFLISKLESLTNFPQRNCCFICLCFV